MYSACIGLIVLCLVAHNDSETVQGHSRSGFSSHGPEGSYSSWIRHLGAVQAWPNLQGSTGVMLGVVDVGAGTGVTLGTAGVWFLNHRHCRCNRQRLQQLGRLDRCRWCHRSARSCKNLQCGWCDSWVSVSGLDTAFTKVLSCVAVDHTITGVHLVAVFQQDTYHSGRDPELTEGIIHCHGLASIQGCKRFASFVCLRLGGIGMGINSFTNLEGCQISVVNSGRNGGPNLALVQKLCR